MYRGISNTPFHRHQREDTLKQYTTHLYRLLLLLLRTHKNEDNHVDIDIHWQPKHDKLTNAISVLKHALQDITVQNNSDILLPLIHNVTYQLWTFSYTATTNDPAPDPTERYLMLQSLQADGSFAEPLVITPVLAKFKYLLRLVMMYELIHCHFIQSHTSIHERSSQIHPWIHEKINDSTFNMICALQHRASAIAYETMGLPRLYWPNHDDCSVFNYRGTQLALEDIRTMFHATEDQLIHLFEEDIMMGLNLKTTRKHLAEDLSNTAVGYSFLADNRNQFLSSRSLMLETVFKTPALRDRFLYIDQHGSVQWKINGLQKWLTSYSELSALLLLRCETLAGGPGRGTELTAMQYRSTPTRGIRNLVVFGKHMLMLRTYGKTSMLTGKDRLIPHSLDAVTGDIILQDLVYARPFAEFVVSKLYPTQPDIGLLYHNHLFVKEDRLFQTDDLSALLKQVTNRHLRKELGVNAWRHIAIALRRKLCPTEVDLMENGVEDTIDAEQAGHNAETERKRYGLSPDALAGQAEDVLPLFLNASTSWQKAMKTVPGQCDVFFTQCNITVCLLPCLTGGLDLSYQAARYTQFERLVSKFKIKSNGNNTPTHTLAIDTETMVNNIMKHVTSAMTQQFQDLANILALQVETTVKKVIEDHFLNDASSQTHTARHEST